MDKGRPRDIFTAKRFLADSDMSNLRRQHKNQKGVPIMSTLYVLEHHCVLYFTNVN